MVREVQSVPKVRGAQLLRNRCSWILHLLHLIAPVAPLAPLQTQRNTPEHL